MLLLIDCTKYCGLLRRVTKSQFYEASKDYKQAEADCVAGKPPFYPSLIWSDFDGDGQKDYAVRISRGRNAITIAFLKRGAGFKDYMLYTDQEENGVLELSKKGGKYFDHERNRGGVYPNDTITIGYCGVSAIAFIYRNGVFQKVFTSD